MPMQPRPARSAFTCTHFPRLRLESPMIADASSQTPAGVMPQSAKTRAMTKHEASRTLLKSPPELWAECSDAASLSRHLDQFGEIKITRLEPETAVAWEGNAISG